MSLEFLTAAMTARADKVKGLDARLQFDFGEEGVLLIDGRTDPPSISNDKDPDADCTVVIAFEDMLRMIKREVGFGTFYAMGLLDVHGDFAVVMRLQEAIEA